MKRLRIALLAGVLSIVPLGAQQFRTDITKWQDGKLAAVSMTYDDSTINQFRIALPMMNERGLPATFFVITGEVPGSEHRPTFVGRPIMDIIRESAKVPTNKDNALERSSLLRYLGEIQRVEIVLKNFRPNSAGGLIEKGDFAMFDTVLAMLRESAETYGVKPVIPVRSQEDGRPPAIHPGGLTWDEFRSAGKQGHEIGNHLVSHAHTPGLDEANILYEAMKADEDIRAQMGEAHAFSIEASYGIHDPRVEKILVPRFSLTRNWVTDEFMDGILRGDDRDPATMKKEYVQWQRGPVTKTSVEEMKAWIDKSLATGTWLVLVIHGVEGIGYQPIPAEHLRAYFDYMKANENRLWVATFRDAGKYARERMASKVTTKQAGDALEVTLTHSLNPRLYNFPLTARTTVPAQWTAVEVRQGNVQRIVPVQREAGDSYVMYRIQPNLGVARLRPAPPVIAQQAAPQTPTPEGYVPRGTRPARGLAPGLKVTDLGKSARTYRVNMTKGDDILSGLTEFAEKYRIRNGHFTALGAIDKGLFGWTDVERGTGQKKIELNEEAEIVSLMGSISVNAQGQSNVHAHGTVALSDGTVKGGHWWEARVSIIAEVFVTEEEGAPDPPK